ncbi:MAG: carotenoid oxygenase family protein, partial [Bacteroidota bacterium]
FISASREELDIDLNVIEGELPQDLAGHVYFNSAVGTVDSGGLPFVKKDHEDKPLPDYGSPLFNGDGMMIRMDFDEKGKVKLKTRLAKTPTYWADYALREGGPARADKRFDSWDWKFNSTGMARFSMQLGQANQLNVAMVPIRFDDSGPIRMLGTYEAGRPWEVDPLHLDLKAPILKNDDTASLVPEWLWRYPFKAILATAHPTWDYHDKKVYVVNYLKGVSTLVGFQRILISSLRDPEKTKERIIKAAEKARAKGKEKGQREFERFMMEDTKDLPAKKDPKFKDLFEDIKESIIPDDAVFLTQWDGTPDVQRWRIRCGGKDIKIRDNMHQMGVTENYVIFSDSSFKVNLSLMFNLIKPLIPDIEETMRELFTQPMNPISALYFVKKSDLVPGKSSVEAVRALIPLECVHFTANYKEEDGLITVMTANNTANCPAEWMRHFDKVMETGEPIDMEYLGYLSVGPMDIGRVGRFVFDPTTGKMMDDKTSVLFETGNLNDPKNIGAHTWAVGLYTFRGYEEVGPRVDHLKSMYWQIYGLDKDHVTEFIFELYKDYPNREVSIEKMEELCKTGVPIGLARVDHSAPKLKIDDFYLFEEKHYIRSIQFIPRDTRNEAIPEDQDGYILCTVTVPVNLAEGQYRSEVWLWDASDLAKGPVCKLQNDKFRFAYTFHSVWIEKAEETHPPTQIDVIDDIDDQVLMIGNPARQNRVEEFMDEYVYPHFADQENAIDDPDPKDYSGKAYKWMLKK